jgi:hypothetical protein
MIFTEPLSEMNVSGIICCCKFSFQGDKAAKQAKLIKAFSNVDP